MGIDEGIDLDRVPEKNLLPKVSDIA